MRDEFLERLPELNAGLYSHLMQTLSEEEFELDIELAGCSDKVRYDLKREQWVLVGVIKFGLQSDLLQEIARRFAEIGKVPKGYPTNN